QRRGGSADHAQAASLELGGVGTALDLFHCLATRCLVVAAGGSVGSGYWYYRCRCGFLARRAALALSQTLLRKEPHALHGLEALAPYRRAAGGHLPVHVDDQRLAFGESDGLADGQRRDDRSDGAPWKTSGAFHNEDHSGGSDRCDRCDRSRLRLAGRQG